MTKDNNPESFVDQMTLLIEDVENGRAAEDAEMQQLEFCFALSSTLTLLHHSTYPREKQKVRAAELIEAQDMRRKMALLALDVIAGTKQHEILDKEKAKRSLLFHAQNADMLVGLVRRAMLELKRPNSS